MQEVTVKLKNAKTLKALMDFAEKFDMVVEKKMPIEKKMANKNQADLPIQFAKHPDVTALAGIWKDRKISLDELREKAWGGRL